MKNILLRMLFMVLSLGSAYAQTDESAIKTAIEAESNAYHTNADRMAFVNYWHITPDSRMVYSNREGCTEFTGTQMKDAVANGQMPAADQAKCEYTNYVVRVSGNVGWASFDQKSTTPDGKVATMHEFRMMEKIGGAWKIVCSSVQQY